MNFIAGPFEAISGTLSILPRHFGSRMCPHIERKKFISIFVEWEEENWANGCLI